MSRLVSRHIEEVASSLSRHALECSSGSSITVGVDVVEVGRISRAILRHPTSFPCRFFVDHEFAHAKSKVRPAISFAGMYAAKEAVYKALRLDWDRPFTWRWIEIAHDESGAPRVVFSGNFLAVWPDAQGVDLTVSVSHTQGVAIGVAIGVRDSLAS